VIVVDDLLDVVAAHGAEQVVVGADTESGLRAIVAIHSTVLGPSLGGTRFHPFASERDALIDVLRLAKGMTYKHAVCGNDLGGGKAVIIGDPRTLRSDALLRAYARLVDRIGGRYLTAEDVGTTQADMDLIRTVTPYVTGASEADGGSGDPSPATAVGVFHAMLAVADERWGTASLDGRHVVVSGVGKVGAALARQLHDAGARVTVADVRADVARGLASTLGAEAVDPDAASTVACDIFSPCALGAVLNEHTVPQLRCAAICGCANNQLANDEDGDRLAARDILYAPDYVANAGGVINIAEELSAGGYDRDRALGRVATIRATMARVFAVARERTTTPARAADALAEARLASV
jgi:leucine dehydrogenase